MKILIAFLWFLLGYNSVNAQWLERYPEESPTKFVHRLFPHWKGAILDMHPVIEYSWGDQSQGKKILFFLPAEKGQQGMVQAIVLVPGNNRHYRQVDITQVLFSGTAPHEKILTVFFEDIDGNGDKELLFIKEGTVKDYKTIVAEDGSVWENAPYHYKVYQTFIYRQQKKEGQYLEAFEKMDWPHLMTRLEGLQTAGEVRKVLKKMRNKSK